MNNEPKLVRELEDGWSLRRWEYDGSPLELHGSNQIRIELKGKTLELSVEITQYDGYCSAYTCGVDRDIPVAVIRALLEEKT